MHTNDLSIGLCALNMIVCLQWGSVFGPLLFIIYINYLGLNVSDANLLICI